MASHKVSRTDESQSESKPSEGTPSFLGTDDPAAALESLMQLYSSGDRLGNTAAWCISVASKVELIVGFIGNSDSLSADEDANLTAAILALLVLVNQSIVDCIDILTFDALPAAPIDVFGRSEPSYHHAAYDLANGVISCLGASVIGPRNNPKSRKSRVSSMDVRKFADTFLSIMRCGWGISPENCCDLLEWFKAALRQEFSRAAKERADTEAKQATGTPIVLTPLQQRIITALDGKSLKKDPLALLVSGGEGSRLYEPGGVKELREAGLVSHKHGIGHYRPDAAPPGLIIRRAN